MPANGFDPGKHLIDIKDKPYLGAHEAITWFWAEHPAPSGRIVPYIVDAEHSLVRCEVWVDDVMISAADVRGDGSKSLEKLQTNAVRRALAFAGYGTVGAIAYEENEIGLDPESQMKVAQARHEMAQNRPEGRSEAEAAKETLSPGTGKRVGALPASPPAAHGASESEKKPSMPPSEKEGVIESLGDLRQAVYKATGDSLSDAEIARLGGIGSFDRLADWRKMYATVDEAVAAVGAQLVRELEAATRRDA